jgi:hypothetical protein
MPQLSTKSFFFAWLIMQILLASAGRLFLESENDVACIGIL